MYRKFLIFTLVLLTGICSGQSVISDNTPPPCYPKAIYKVIKIKRVNNFYIIYINSDSTHINYRVVAKKQHLNDRERIKKGRSYKLEICPWGDRKEYYAQVEYLSVGQGVDVKIWEEGQYPDIFYSFDLKGLYYVGGEGDPLRTEDL